MIGIVQVARDLWLLVNKSHPRGSGYALRPSLFVINFLHCAISITHSTTLLDIFSLWNRPL